jgi:hypothetical protein
MNKAQPEQTQFLSTTAEWNVETMARVLSLTTQRVGQLVQEGVLKYSRPGWFDPFLAVPDFLNFLRRRLKSGKTRAAMERRTLAQAELLELELRKATGELVTAESVRYEAFRFGRTIRQTMENIPARISGILAHQSDPKKVAEILTKEIRSGLSMLHDDLKTKKPAARRTQ